MKSLLFLISIILSPLSAADVPETVDDVDLERYSGEWYEVARYPNRFQEDCGATRATYTLKSNKVSVLNECRVNNDPAEIEAARGTAFVVDEQSQSKLKVSFVPLLRHFGFFAGEYWILELDQDYRYALVGDSQRKYLWILSRTPAISQEVLQKYKLLAKKQGFDPSKIQVTPVWRE